MKVLVLGGGGQVARAVASCAPANYSVVVRARATLDITSDAAVASELRETGAAWIVNGAAYTAVDRAEMEPDLARETNDKAVGTLASSATRFGCRLLHLSTDFVFDGMSNQGYMPSDEPHPINVYGETKLAGEQRAIRDGVDAIVLRTSWVYASTGYNFPLTMMRLMRERQEVRVVADQIGTPTWAVSVARAVWGLIEASAQGGIYHWTDFGLATWYDFAVAIQEEALARGLLERAVPVIPITTKEYPTPARRPVFSVLNTELARSIVCRPPQHWRHNLRMMLDELRAT